VGIEEQYNNIEKHGFVEGTEKGIYTGLREGGAYKYKSVVRCTDCHAMHGTHNPKLIIDKTNTGTSLLAPAIRELPVMINVGNGDYSQLCVTCHKMDTLVDEGAKETGNGLSGVHIVGANCSQCHKHSITPQEGLEPSKTIDVSVEQGTLLLTETHGFGGVGWGKVECESCHAMNRIHLKAQPNIKKIVEEVGFNSCMGCHGQNGTNGVRECAICHNEQKLPASPSLQGIEKHDFKVANTLPLDDQSCVICHYSSDMDGKLEADIDLSHFSPDGVANKDEVDFCLKCHNKTHQQPGHEMSPRFPNDPLVAIEEQYSNIEKHGFVEGTKEGIYTGLRSGGAYEYGKVVRCTDCHAMHGTHNPKLIIDRTNTGTSLLDPAIRELPVLINVSDGDYTQLCVTCHKMDKTVDEGGKDAGNGLAGVHAVGVNCSRCHAHTLVPQEGLEEGKKIDVSLDKNQLLLTKTHGFGGVAWGKSECQSCHLMRRIHNTAPKIKGIVEDIGFSSCTGCHGKNGTNSERKCTVCHNPQKLPTSPILEGKETHDFKINETLPLDDTACIACHDRSDMDGDIEAGVDLTRYPDPTLLTGAPYRNGVEFCLSCHNSTHQQPGFLMETRFERDPLTLMDISYKFFDVHGYVDGSGQRTYSGLNESLYRYGDELVECTDCHSMHGTHNPKLIVDRTDKGMVRLGPLIRNLPVKIHVTEKGDYSQLCVTCHSMDEIIEQGDEDTGNGLSGVHQVGTDCRECHVHGLASQTGL
jgi:hypothetical protein